MSTFQVSSAKNIFKVKNA